MKDFVKPKTEEREPMIVLGILTLYFLIAGFVFYLYFLHRIPLYAAGIINLLFTFIYLPRFFLINKLKNKDKIQIVEQSIFINGSEINFSEISDLRVEKHKPVVIFFFNNKMIIFQEAFFHLKTSRGEIRFNVIGSEKIELLKEYLREIIKQH